MLLMSGDAPGGIIETIGSSLQNDALKYLRKCPRERLVAGEASNLEMNVGTHYFLQGGFTVSRGVVQDYDQWMFTLGYRFDTRQRAGAQ